MSLPIRDAIHVEQTIDEQRPIQSRYVLQFFDGVPMEYRVIIASDGTIDEPDVASGEGMHTSR